MPAPSSDGGILTVSRNRGILIVSGDRGILTVLRRVWHAQAVVSLVGPDDHGGDQTRAGEPGHFADGMDFRPGRPAGSYHRYGIGRPRREVLAADGRVKGRQGQQQVSRRASSYQRVSGLLSA